MGGSDSKPQQPGNSFSNPTLSKPMDEEKVAMAQAQQELEAITDMYNRMMDQCFRKCVTHYNEADLTKGESTCVERCVFKYLDVHKKVGERLTSVQQ